MEVDRSNFWEQLPTMLEAISESLYVVVDLELSGVQVHKSHPKVPAKPTLQKAYDAAREAADQYTILQFGFTCVNWDSDKKSYVTKTFNVPLHPGVAANKPHSQWLSRNIKRCISLSANSLSFLESNGFDFSDVIQKGVPYLSSAEFSSKEVSDFILGNRVADDLDVTPLPRSSIEFRDHVRESLSGGDPRLVKIYSPSGGRLNALQKRIVHQLLQDHFPHLMAVNGDGGQYMGIRDCNRNAQLARDSVKQRALAVSRQNGARVLWDAICGRDFAFSIYPELFGTDPVKCMELKAQVQWYESRLRKKRPILVGHNILFDLCFLHSKFVVGLPESVHEFRAATRAVHPRIVDTKYLFTRGGDEMSPDYSLGECFAAVKDQQLPVVCPSPSHTYSKPMFHQSGYDSYMTAIVFLKKSYQLAQTRQHLCYIPSEDLGENEVIRSPSISRPRPTTVNPLEERDEDVVAALARWRILEPQRPIRAPTAPLTPERSPWRKSNCATRDVGMIPDWDGQFWGKFGNRTRVGPFGLVLYMPKMAGEKVAEDERWGNV